jgi:hypothetical protein
MAKMLLIWINIIRALDSLQSCYLLLAVHQAVQPTYVALLKNIGAPHFFA